MKVNHHTTSSSDNTITSFWFELLFWITFACWAFLPDTRNFRLEIESIPVTIKDFSLIALAVFYLLLPAIKNRSVNILQNTWHYHLPLLTISLLLYAQISSNWTAMDERDAKAMTYTLLLTGSACLLGFNLIAQKSVDSIRPFLWRVTVFIAVMGLIYSAESFFSMGWRSELTDEWTDFGIQRVRGPLYAPSTGHFILLPALAYAIEETFQSRHKVLINLTVVFSLTLTILALGSRSALINLALFFLLLILLMKNKKQAAIAAVVMLVAIALSWFLVFAQASTERLQSLEESGRSQTHHAAFKIVQTRPLEADLFGSGYGSYWPWYLPEIEDGGPKITNRYINVVWNPFDSILYHPHSTFLLLIVELGTIGFLYFGWLWLALFRLLFGKRKHTGMLIFNSGIVATSISLFFDFYLFRATLLSSIWWIFLFGALALNFRQKLVQEDRS